MSATNAATCRWATPTLFMNNGLWLDAWEYPWTCRREGVPRILRALDDCTTCSHWESKSEGRPFRDSEVLTPVVEERV